MTLQEAGFPQILCPNSSWGLAGYPYEVFIFLHIRERPGISEVEEMLIDCTAHPMDISLSPAYGSHSKVANFRQNR